MAATENGEVIDQGDEIVLEVIDSVFTVRRNGVLEIEGTFKVDSDRNPKTIDWLDHLGADTGKEFKSMCVMGQDCLEFCAADAGLPRPKHIEAKQGYTVRRFQRLRIGNLE